MKKIRQLILFCCCALLLSVLPAFHVSAATAGISTSGTPKVGETIRVNLSVSADKAIYSADSTLNYDGSVLQLVSVDGVNSGDYVGGNGSVHIVDANFGENDKSASYSVTFKVLKAGQSSLSYAGSCADIDLNEASFSKSSSVTVQAEQNSKPESKPASKPASSSSKPTVSSSSASSASSKKPDLSSNADLQTLSVSGASLSPAFSAATTSYTVQVDKDIEKITVSAAPADSKAKITGGGAYTLDLGTNYYAITVVAQDGTKKTYSLAVKRGTDEEIDVLAVTVKGTKYHVCDDLSKVKALPGFSIRKAVYNGVEVDVFSDKENQLALYYLTEDASGKGDYFVYQDQRDSFKLLDYITWNNRKYIFADDGLYDPPEGYTTETIKIAKAATKAYLYSDEQYADFYVVYCIVDGEGGYYRYDSVEKTLQRLPVFPETVAVNTDEPLTQPEQTEEADTNWFSELSRTGKIAVLLFAVVALCLIFLIIFLPIIALVKKKRNRKPEEKSFDFSFDEVEYTSADNAAPEAADQPSDEE